jgi:hypothetical protein
MACGNWEGGDQCGRDGAASLACCAKVRNPLKGQAQDHVAYCCELLIHDMERTIR